MAQFFWSEDFEKEMEESYRKNGNTISIHSAIEAAVTIANRKLKGHRIILDENPVDESTKINSTFPKSSTVKAFESQRATNIYGIMSDVLDEIQSASDKFPPFNSAHEGYGVLTEEYKELESHVFKNQKKRDILEMRSEAIQVAAMAIKFIHDVCNEEVGRR